MKVNTLMCYALLFATCANLYGLIELTEMIPSYHWLYGAKVALTVFSTCCIITISLAIIIKGIASDISCITSHTHKRKG